MSILIGVFLLIAIAFVLAISYYHRHIKSKWQIAFISIRILLFLTLFFSFIEPILTFERIASPSRVMPILIDNSLSMQLFNPDSSVVPFIDSLLKVKLDIDNNPIVFKPFLFGDSIAEFHQQSRIPFTNNQSFFPTYWRDKQTANAPCWLLISDGNFSNPSVPKELLSDKNVTYSVLPNPTIRANLKITVHTESTIAPKDSIFPVTVRYDGFSPVREDGILFCRINDKTVSRKSLNLGKGFFSDTTTIRLKSVHQGRFLFAISISMPRDTLYRTVYFPLTIVPSKFNAGIVSNSPVLDERFLKIALDNDEQWKIADDTTKQFDALFCFDLSSPDVRLISKLQPRGVLAFLGKPPFETPGIVSAKTFVPLFNHTYESVFQQLRLHEVPAPLEMYRYEKQKFTNLDTLISCIVSANSITDTIPFLTRGRIFNHDDFIAAGTELWHMDFWPLSLIKQSESTSFLQYFTGLIKQQIIANSFNNFIAFPDENDDSEKDSVRFSLLLPFEISSQLESSGKIFAQIKIDSLNRSIESLSSIPVSIFGATPPTVTVPSPKNGKYKYRVTITAHGNSYEYSDSLFIGKNQEELFVTGQNTALLNQFGTPLQSNSVKAVLKAYHDASSANRNIVIDSLEIRKTWALLFIIVLLLIFEWIFRKKQELE